MLRTLDVFAGIGGFTHALRGLAAPAAYCESDEDARCVLRANMKAGRLPTAPICPDIRELDAAWLRGHKIAAREVDAVMGGFPCTGMSVVGKRAGFANAETALFYELLRVVDLTRPSIVYLENSPHILALGNAGVGEVTRQLQRRGYDVRFTVLGAFEIGAPHRRRRWFCLAMKPALVGRTLKSSLPYRPYLWDAAREPARTIAVVPVRWRQRLERLGLSVVPDVVRYAFARLAGGYPAHVSVRGLCDVAIRPVADSIQRAHSKGDEHTPHMHFTADGRAHDIHASFHTRIRDYHLVLDPSKYKANTPPSSTTRTALVTHPLHRTHWATVIPAVAGMRNYLTERTQSLLDVQVRFEACTKHRQHRLSPEFAEWLMGFPLDWTRC